MEEGVLGGQYDVLQELGVREGGDLVVDGEVVVLRPHRRDAARVHPLGLGLPTAAAPPAAAAVPPAHRGGRHGVRDDEKGEEGAEELAAEAELGTPRGAAGAAV